MARQALVPGNFLRDQGHGLWEWAPGEEVSRKRAKFFSGVVDLPDPSNFAGPRCEIFQIYPILGVLRIAV